MTKVLPGDFLADIEESVGGANTFEEEGHVYAASQGVRRDDAAARVVGVQADTTVRLAGGGDLVYGRVRDIFEAMASIEIQAVESRSRRPVVNDSVAYLRISEVQRGYLERFRDVIRIGDMVRARVVQTSPLAVYVSIKDPDLGVVRAACSRCRAWMDYHSNFFLCPECGSREERKTPVVPREGGGSPDERGAPRRESFASRGSSRFEGHGSEGGRGRFEHGGRRGRHR